MKLRWTARFTLICPLHTKHMFTARKCLTQTHTVETTLIIPQPLQLFRPQLLQCSPGQPLRQLLFRASIMIPQATVIRWAVVRIITIFFTRKPATQARAMQALVVWRTLIHGFIIPTRYWCIQVSPLFPRCRLWLRQRITLTVRLSGATTVTSLHIIPLTAIIPTAHISGFTETGTLQQVSKTELLTGPGLWEQLLLTEELTGRLSIRQLTEILTRITIILYSLLINQYRAIIEQLLQTLLYLTAIISIMTLVLQELRIRRLIWQPIILSLLLWQVRTVIMLHTSIPQLR